MHLDEVDLAEVVVTAMHDAEASAPGHLWTVDLSPAPAVVCGDRERLHQVVLNLLSNAGLHTPAGTTVACRVTILPGSSDGSIELEVRENGPGIAEDLLPVLFQRFAHGGSSTHRSSGLGLAIVASIVEAHHGGVDVDSSPAGTAFRVVLPGVECLAAPPPSPGRDEVLPTATAPARADYPCEPAHDHAGPAVSTTAGGRLGQTGPDSST